MTKKCNNPVCGHDENKHLISGLMIGGCYPRLRCSIKGCPCKKFEAETAGSKIKKLMNDLEDGKLKKSQKAEDEIQNFVKGFVKFEEDNQLKRAKEMKSRISKLNVRTLEWLRDTCIKLLQKKPQK